MRPWCVLIPVKSYTTLSVSRSWNTFSEYLTSLTAAVAAAGGHTRCSSILHYRFDAAVDHANEEGAHLLLYCAKQLHAERVLGWMMDHSEHLAALVD
jgi:hypothetical protein